MKSWKKHLWKHQSKYFNRGFIHDTRSNTYVYIARVLCSPGHSTHYDDGFTLFVKKQEVENAEKWNAIENFLQFPVPKAFSDMMAYLMTKIK